MNLWTATHFSWRSKLIYFHTLCFALLPKYEKEKRTNSCPMNACSCYVHQLRPHFWQSKRINRAIRAVLTKLRMTIELDQFVLFLNIGHNLVQAEFELCIFTIFEPRTFCPSKEIYHYTTITPATQPWTFIKASEIIKKKLPRKV